MRTLIHVNQYKIKARDPEPITVKTYKSNTAASQVDIMSPDGAVLAKVIYSPDAPLPCGARVWIETEHEVVIRDGPAVQDGQ